jgi:plastocyanin
MKTELIVRTVVVAIAVSAGASCFSERPDGISGPATGECRVALDSEVVGQVGVIVGLKDFAFHPQELHVPRGTRVTWVDCEDENVDFHTTTSDAGLWNSDAMTTGSTFSRVFDVPGRYDYHCIPHEQFMRGVIIVD